MISRVIARWSVFAVLGLLAFLALISGQRTPVAAGSLSFSGTVVTPSGTAYTDGGGVNLYNNSGFWTNAGINSDGTFSITGLNPGTYTVDVGVSNASSYANPAQQQVTITSNVAGFQISVATVVVRGTLAKPDGTPTNGCVNVRNATYTLQRGYCPDTNGLFKLGAIEAGTYILEANVPDNVPYVSTSQGLTITNPATALDVGTVKFENPFLTGKVVLPNGSPLPWSEDWNQRVHLSVDLWNNDRTVDKHSNYDANGQFKFGRMPAGVYTIHVNVWDTEVYTGSENVTVTVPAGGLNMTANPIRLSTPLLSGIVYRPDGTTPVPNVWLNLHNDDWSVSQGNNSDQNGKYRIGGLAAGTYTLEVNPPQEMTDVVRPDPVAVTITGSLQTRNITLSTAKKFVSGTVKKTDGTPVACAQVNANLRGGNGWANARTNSSGSFTLTLKPGAWNVRVERSNSFDCPNADWIYLDPEAVVEFGSDSGTETQTVNFTVQKATAVITGTVKKSDGTLVTNGNVNANSQTPDGRNRNANAQIQSDGTYRIALVGGSYDLNVWTNDNRLFTRNQKVTVADHQTLTAHFVMKQKLAHIKGLVTDKGGNPLANIQLNGNLDCGPQGCAAWSNTTTAVDGTYDMAVTAGQWFINFDSGRGQAYVYDGPQKDIYVETETGTVTGVNFVLTYADVTIKGKIVDDTGKPFAEFPGWAYVRPLTVTAGNGLREYGGSVNQGTFNFRVPSSVFSQAELGIHTPPNSQYSSPTGQAITLVADATIEKNITVQKNNAAIIGKVLDSSGFPLQNCNFRGEVFANAPNIWYGTQINPDCTYEISLLAGRYNVGYHIEESAGFLNRPQNSQVTVGAGTRLQFDFKVLAGDARVTVLVLNPDGSPARHAWVRAENRKEIDDQRRNGEEQSGAKAGNQAGFFGPGGTKSPEELMKYCSKKENEKECRDFKFPPGASGPGGTKDALAAVKYCQSHKSECDKLIKGEPGASTKAVVGQSVVRRRAKIASLKLVRAAGETEAESNDPFANMISTGSETNEKGSVTLSLLSGHEYQIDANVPAESDSLPPQTQTVNLKDTKTASMTLQLRTADGKMKGFVTWNKVAVRNGWVGCWSEDGSSNGAPINNGTYSLNYSFNTTYHCDANSFDGNTMLRSGEHIVTIGTKKTTTQHFALGESSFVIPPPVSESFDATQQHVITLADGTTINIPANTIATSGTVTVTANPTINVQSQVTAKPIGYGYNLEAKDENSQVVSTFKNNVTMSFTYTQAQLDEAGVSEDSLVPSYWDSSSGTWKKPSNITQTTISQSADGTTGSITTTTNHFTAYALVSSGGKAGRRLLSVKTKSAKGGTQIVVGSAKKVTFTPFKGYQGPLVVATFVAGKTGQVIAAGPANGTSGTTIVKLFDVKGKLRQSYAPGGAQYKQGLATLNAQDLTRDGRDDLAMVPKIGTSVTVVDFQKKKNHAIAASASATSLQAAILDLGTGTQQLVTAAGTNLKAWRYNGKTFTSYAYDTAKRLRVTSSGIERIYLQPNIVNVSPRTVSRTKSVVVTIQGENFGAGSRALIDGTLPATKVVAKGETVVTVTFNLSSLKAGKHDLQIINPDGMQATWQKVLKVK